jgi:4'-phosphopantetheinyl transferase
MINTKDGCKPPTGAISPNADLVLPLGQVDVWVAMASDMSESEMAAQFDRVLSDHERRQHGEFLFEKDRRRYLTTRSLVRYVLSRYVPIPPAAWRFDATAFGRPFIVNSHPDVSAMTFSISHSDRVVVLGLARGCQLGIDVEDLHRNVPVAIAGSVFSAAEVRQLHALPPAGQPHRFLDFWTLKESYIKARGKGLSLPLDKFSFELTGKRQLQVCFDASLNDSPDHWTFWQWSPSRDSIAALCVENQTGIKKTIKVRRIVPFVREEEIDFDVLRISAPVTKSAIE